MSAWLSKIMQQTWLEVSSGQLVDYKHTVRQLSGSEKKICSKYSIKMYFISEMLGYHNCGALDKAHKENHSTTAYRLGNERLALQPF